MAGVSFAASVGCEPTSIKETETFRQCHAELLDLILQDLLAVV